MVNPPGGGTRTSRMVCADLPPTGVAVWWLWTAPRLQPVHLTYPVGVRDSAARGWGPKVSRRLKDLAETRFVNVRGCPDTEGQAVGPRHRGSVGAVIVCAGQRAGQEGSSPSGARMRGAVSKSGGNASLAGERKVWRPLNGHEGESRIQPRGTWSRRS